MDSNGGSTMGAILYLIIVIAIIAGLWKVFEKAGKPGWAVLIPIYNIYVLLQICGRPWWWLLLLLIPIVSLVIMIIVYLDLVKKFGQPGWHVLGAIFLPFVYFPWLGFGPATYQG